MEYCDMDQHKIDKHIAKVLADQDGMNEDKGWGWQKSLSIIALCLVIGMLFGLILPI